MIRKLLLAAALCLVAAPALAQNTTCATRPNGDSSNACASTAFVQNAIGGGTPIPLTQYHFLIGDAANQAANTALGGDCVYTTSYGIVCTKTNNIAFSTLATSTDAANLTGNLAIARFNSGTGATSTTYWRGDGTWGTIASGGITGTTTVSGASTTYTSAQNNLLITRSNSGAPMIDTLPGTSPGILPSGTIITIKNNDTAGVLAINVGAGAALKAFVAPTGFVYLCPGQSVGFYSDGTNYWSFNQPATCFLGGATTFYAAASGTSTTNNGLTSAAPLTPNGAYQLAQWFNANGKTVTIQLADGTYTTPFQVIGPIPGQGRSVAQSNIFPVILQGNTTTPANVIISTSTSTFGAISVFNNADVLIQGFNLITTTIGSGLYVEYASASIKAITFGNAAINNVSVTRNGYAQIVGALTFNGVSGCAFLQSNSWISFESTATITLAGGPLMTAAFVCSQDPGSIVVDATPTFSGAINPSTVRYTAFLNGIINTGGAGATFFPGGVAGTTATGGQYN